MDAGQQKLSPVHCTAAPPGSTRQRQRQQQRTTAIPTMATLGAYPATGPAVREPTADQLAHLTDLTSLFAWANLPGDPEYAASPAGALLMIIGGGRNPQPRGVRQRLAGTPRTRPPKLEIQQISHLGGRTRRGLRRPTATARHLAALTDDRASRGSTPRCPAQLQDRISPRCVQGI